MLHAVAPLWVGVLVTPVGLVLLSLLVLALYSSVERVGPHEKRALTVFGEYRQLLEPGLNVVPPFVSNTHAFDMRPRTIDVPRQEAVTRDNSPVTADAVVVVEVVDAEKAFLEVDNYTQAVSNLARTTLRSVLGQMELDEVLDRRELLGADLRDELDEHTREWGVRVESVEIGDLRRTEKDPRKVPPEPADGSTA